MKKNILITNMHKARGGGHTTFIKQLLTSKLLRSQFNFAVSAPEGCLLESICKFLDVPFYPCPYDSKIGRPIKMVKEILRVREIFNEFKPDLIHCNGSPDMTAWRFGTLDKQVPMMRVQHAVKRIKTNLYTRWFFEKINVVYVSYASRDYAFNMGSMRPKYQDVIELGVDTEYFSPREKDLELTNKLNILPTDFVVGTAAGMAKQKRVDLMIEAIGIVRRYSTTPIKLLILGDEHNWPRLREHAKKHGVEDIVIYPGHQSDIRPCVSLFDVGFMISDSVETLSYATREMMSMGIPVISSDYPGIPNNVDHGVNGLKVHWGQVAPVVAAIMIFLNMSPETLNSMKMAARNKSVTKFSLNEQLLSYERLYKKLIK